MPRVQVTCEVPSLDELCRSYWDVDEDDVFVNSVKSLADKGCSSAYEITNVVRQSCFVTCVGVACPACGNLRKFRSRTEFLTKRTSEVCGTCIAKAADDRWRSATTQLDRRKRALESLHKSRTYNRKYYDDMTISEAVYLLSFIRAMGSEDLTEFGPLKSLEQYLAPQWTLSIDIIRELSQSGLICVHPKSPIESWIFADDDAPRSFFVETSVFTLTAGIGSQVAKSVVSELEEAFRTSQWPESWDSEEALQLWKTVSRYECLQYLEIVLQEHGLPFNPGEKTIAAFDAFLEWLSVGQIYGLIWTAGTNAAAFLLREQVSRQHAANTVVGKMQRHAERALAEGWELKVFRRDRRATESVVSHVLTRTCLHLQDGGFGIHPNLGAIEAC